MIRTHWEFDPREKEGRAELKNSTQDEEDLRRGLRVTGYRLRCKPECGCASNWMKEKVILRMSSYKTSHCISHLIKPAAVGVCRSRAPSCEAGNTLLRPYSWVVHALGAPNVAVLGEATTCLIPYCSSSSPSPSPLTDQTETYRLDRLAALKDKWT